MGGEPQCRTADLKVGVGGFMAPDMPAPMGWLASAIPVMSDGTAAYVQVQEGGTSHIYRVALAGPQDWEPVVSGERCCQIADLNDQYVLFSASHLTHPTDLFVTDLDGQNERQITQINADLLAQLHLPAVEHLEFMGIDGTPVEGWLVTPTSGEAPYPTILCIHGGPHSALGHVFHFGTVMLAGAGYAVALINHRASTGYGDAFSTAILGDWGNLDYADLMAGIDEAVGRGLADPNRLGVTGVSGGGFLTCWIVGHTERFKAAVPENGFTDWNSFYGTSDIGVWYAFTELGGHPHEIPEVYRKCSPITYAHQCKTPTLLIHGEHDWRCPIGQSEQFFTVLRAHGCIAEMLRFPESSHIGTLIGVPRVRRAQNEALLGWFNQHILGD